LNRVDRPETLNVVADSVVMIALAAEMVWAPSVFVTDALDSVASPHTFKVVVVSVPDTLSVVVDKVVITP
jgi:hypothetical protein